MLVGLKDPSALDVADRALKLKPDTAYVLGTTGWAAFHAGKADRALQLLRDARLRDPSHAGIRYYLGSVLAQQGRKGEAREELEAAVRLGAGTVYAQDASALLKTVN
ncbi:MAG: tetratricopeptide repeat protein [Betaproteobacteria bacterium]|nr:tetratricopeptide repeat protein [Betaproteobacteria bacterium]